MFIHSSDNDGRSTLNRFQNKATSYNVKVAQIIEFEPGLLNDFVDILNQTKNELSCRVFVLYADEDDATAIFDIVKQLNMTTTGYVWLVSEQAIEANNKVSIFIFSILTMVSYVYH